ncbi:hypothetical protein FOMPIDRAFT_1078370, partial [Fomitopsis schrenkii]
ICGACGQPFRTVQGLMAHQSSSRKCAWYKKGKLRAIFDDSDSEDSDIECEADDSGKEQGDEEEVVMEQLIFRAPPPSDQDPQAGPSSGVRQAPTRVTAIALDDDEDTRVEIVDDSAAAEREDGKTLMEAWKHYFERKEAERAANKGAPNMSGESVWAPFESETDWQIASWFVKEGIGHGAVDRLLEIPKVCDKLGLSYHNMRALLQKVDSIPERAPWKEGWLTFKDRPGERHLVQFRDIIKALKALLGNPAHAKKIVWRPSRVFAHRGSKNRIYTEMWTGSW